MRLIGVGRLVEKKGFPHLIEAVRCIVDRGRDITLVLIGEGTERPVLEAAIRAGGLVERVTLIGALPHDRVAQHLLAAHIFVAPCVTASNGDQDAPVNTIKEAMAARPWSARATAAFRKSLSTASTA